MFQKFFIFFLGLLLAFPLSSSIGHKKGSFICSLPSIEVTLDHEEVMSSVHAFFVLAPSSTFEAPTEEKESHDKHGNTLFRFAVHGVVLMIHELNHSIGMALHLQIEYIEHLMETIAFHGIVLSQIFLKKMQFHGLHMRRSLFAEWVYRYELKVVFRKLRIRDKEMRGFLSDLLKEIKVEDKSVLTNAFKERDILFLCEQLKRGEVAVRVYAFYCLASIAGRVPDSRPMIVEASYDFLKEGFSLEMEESPYPILEWLFIKMVHDLYPNPSSLGEQNQINEILSQLSHHNYRVGRVLLDAASLFIRDGDYYSSANVFSYLEKKGKLSGPVDIERLRRLKEKWSHGVEAMGEKGLVRSKNDFIGLKNPLYFSA